ncbi:hypothetical protein KIPB_000137 [Kipferlia bialata]|uniref:Uncharacterized protein n=1 Tax=Kipferlia bialata TaxID=797122 RepID=A0A9K3CQ22_9EUKA|nr:hypothetical protein KIPB_000137 [Kipferlia bialata]|eukprot:g137.t1
MLTFEVEGPHVVIGDVRGAVSGAEADPAEAEVWLKPPPDMECAGTVAVDPISNRLPVVPGTWAASDVHDLEDNVPFGVMLWNTQEVGASEADAAKLLHHMEETGHSLMGCNTSEDPDHLRMIGRYSWDNKVDWNDAEAEERFEPVRELFCGPTVLFASPSCMLDSVLPHLDTVAQTKPEPQGEKSWEGNRVQFPTGVSMLGDTGAVLATFTTQEYLFGRVFMKGPGLPCIALMTFTYNAPEYVCQCAVGDAPCAPAGCTIPESAITQTEGGECAYDMEQVLPVLEGLTPAYRTVLCSQTEGLLQSMVSANVFDNHPEWLDGSMIRADMEGLLPTAIRLNRLTPETLDSSPFSWRQAHEDESIYTMLVESGYPLTYDASTYGRDYTPAMKAISLEFHHSLAAMLGYTLVGEFTPGGECPEVDCPEVEELAEAERHAAPCDVNETTGKGWTAVCEACLEFQPVSLAILLKAGATIPTGPVGTGEKSFFPSDNEAKEEKNVLDHLFETADGMYERIGRGGNARCAYHGFRAMPARQEEPEKTEEELAAEQAALEEKQQLDYANLYQATSNMVETIQVAYLSQLEAAGDDTAPPVLEPLMPVPDWYAEAEAALLEEAEGDMGLE